MSNLRLAPALAGATFSLIAACAPAMRTPSVAPGAPALPPIPAVQGPLLLNVVYPPEGGEIAVRDSTFVFGSVGTGSATLRINGAPVPVEPNGAFLAFLPVPADGVYRFEATAGAETATLQRNVQLPPAPPVPQPGRATIVPGSPFPTGSWSAPAGETTDVGFTGTPGGRAFLVFSDGTRIPLIEQEPAAAVDAAQRIFGTDPARQDTAVAAAMARYRGILPVRPLASADPSAARPTLAAYALPAAPAAGPALAGSVAFDNGGLDGGAAAVALAMPPVSALFELVVGSDTARAPLALNAAVLDPRRLPTGILYDPDIDQSADRMIVGRPGPGYTFHYFWPNGTEVRIDGELNQEYRVRLTRDRTAWVPADRVRLRPAGSPPPTGPVGTVRMSPHAGGVDVHLELPARMPFQVTEELNRLHLFVFGGRGNTAWLQYGRLDPLVQLAEWDQPADDVYHLTIELTQPVWGYRVSWSESGDLVLGIRRPPAIDPRRPLQGRLIAVDAGHPPGGAIGPTGLTEAEANLAIALRLQRLLENAGARVLMTRTGPDAVALQLRPQMAVDANADILVSVHNNAFPDGVNPFLNNGTSTYYFHPQSVDLAQKLQAELLAELRLRDIGYGRSNLALVRPTWMPSTLTETMFLMVPQQENALRDPTVQERIARAHLRGIEAFLLERAAYQ